MEEDEVEEVQLNNDLERKIADVFDVFDHAGTKTIDIREVGTVVRGLGCCPTEAEVQEITFKVEDHSNPGNVRLATFIPYACQFLAEHKYEPATPEQLLEAFHTLDSEGYGYLTKDNLITLMTQAGEPFNQDELDEMLELAIDPHTNTLPYEYYINQLMFEPPEDKDIYKLSDIIEAEKPPPPPPTRRMSEFMAEMESEMAT
ncbi:unnamed protein product [Brassicogethes aeneus]|uniref:EF-hand domain-containing protein n=1 Tax=Brassicogethes aeneus TaxID=1431903 RepID=A0A9P0ASP9_BRAAE|nr:unnamed protein product [Brassicogethes aeneus]